MIVPMKKITLVVLDREREEALTALRKTGVLHIEQRETSSQVITDLHAEINRIDLAISVLSDSKPDKKAVQMPALDREKTLALISRILEIRDKRRTALDSIAQIERELVRLAPWGEVDPKGFEYLAHKGIHLFPFEMSAQDYTLIPNSIRSIVVNRDKKNIRTVIYVESNQLPAGIPSAARSFSLPEKSTSTLREDYEAARALLPELSSQLAAEARYSNSLIPLKTRMLKELEFEIIRSGMQFVSLDTNPAVSTVNGIAGLTGFVPAPEEHQIALAAKENGWAFISDDPSDDDNVPTKIKNNRFVTIISPLFDFLGTVPGYREQDISLWFLIFFGIFFAMIFGDAGYGSLLACAAVYGIFSCISKKKEVPTGLFMLLYLGGMTLAWGTITCTWFGIPIESLPRFFRSIALPAFSGENPDSGVNIKVFCFTLGLIQISLAHVIGIIHNRRTLKVLGEFGALVMAIGMYFVVLNLVVDAEKYPLTTVVLGLVIGGFFLNYLFINYSGSVAGGILESTKNIITMILGVVNMFGDIMSYIRLWAVGLAGAAISATVNQMAGPMFGGLFIFFGILLLFFGHGLNTVMNVLSVLVHGVRLNTLEFSNHLGLTWSGFKYEPFSETVKK